MFVDYVMATDSQLPEPTGVLYQYVIAGNGIFVRAARPGLQALIWTAPATHPIRGLVNLEPYVRIEQQIPRAILYVFLDLARDAVPNECLCYVGDTPSWNLYIPSQVQAPGSVYPSDPYNPMSIHAMLEIHSHGWAAPFFSDADNRDETGFRLYAVLGRVSTPRPEIRARVGIYGHTWEIPASTIFELPDEIEDAMPNDRYSIVNDLDVEDEYAGK